MAIRIQCRRGTAAQWTSANPTLAAGEWGVETDLLPADVKIKMGDGATAWASLPYHIDTTAASGGGTWGSITGTLSAQTDLQSALDAKQALLSLAASTFYARGASGAAANKTISDDALAFVAAANNAAMRTALGLGSAAVAATGDFDAAGAAAAAQAASQPVDSDLTAIAALTTTAYGRAFLALADAAAGRTALALGTAATSATGDFATAAQGALADTAVQPAGNVATATALATARNIGGISFNGTAAIEPSVSEVSRTTSWTLGLSDRNTLQVQTHASPQTCTIPPQSSVTWVGPTTILILAHGSGALTLDADTGVTLNGVSGGSVALNRYQNAVLRWISSDVWVVSGTSADVA